MNDIRNISTEFERASRINECFHYDKNSCSIRIIKAHSVSESSNLNLIKEEVMSQVGVYSTSYKEWEIKENRRFHKPKIVGVSKASTFKGFCETHDKLFSDAFESKLFDPSNKEHLFLHVYRSHAREYHRKIEECKGVKELLKKGIRVMSNNDLNSTMLGVIEMEVVKDRLNQILRDKEYDKLIYKVVKLEHVFPISCSSSFSPDYSYDGTRVNDPYSDQIMDSLFLTIFPDKRDCTYVILGCLPEHIRSEKFIDDLPEDMEELQKAISSLIITYVGNAFFSPSLWENMSETEKNTFRFELQSTISEEHRRYTKGFFHCKTNLFMEKKHFNLTDPETKY